MEPDSYPIYPLSCTITFFIKRVGNIFMIHCQQNDLISWNELWNLLSWLAIPSRINCGTILSVSPHPPLFLFFSWFFSFVFFFYLNFFDISITYEVISPISLVVHCYYNIIDYTLKSDVEPKSKLMLVFIHLFYWYLGNVLISWIIMTVYYSYNIG